MRARMPCLVFVVLLGAGLTRANAQVACSVFDARPCAPAFCSVFDHGVCIPDYGFPIGQDLRATIDSRFSASGVPPTGLNTIHDVFTALRDCWLPPPREVARPGMEMSIRFAFKRNGEMLAPPRVTYVSKDASPEQRKTYREAVTQALQRCNPLSFTSSLGNAIAGRPIAIRFVDNRIL
jgi:hypothetical protein